MTITRSGKLTAGGILAIISGVYGLLNGLIMVFSAPILIDLVETYSTTTLDTATLDMLSSIFAVLGIIGIVLSIITLIGGIFALKKTNYLFALIGGGICGILTGGILGILALVFIILSHSEFITQKPGTSASPEIKTGA
ncbi:MAG: hypothetical protein NTV30_10550 [Chloroflexi bacterium]|nr:hypothetical protein [Chloroflexota bacterium]